MSNDHDVEQPDLLGSEFSAFREQLLAELQPPGPDAVRRTVRRRRQVTSVAVAVAAVLAVAVPVAVYAGLVDRRPAPTDTVGPIPPTGTPTVPPEPSASATPTGTPSPPDGRISREQLLGVAVDLPDWPASAPDGCGTGRVRLRSGPAGTAVPALLDLRHGDVDGDGAAETVALLECRDNAGRPKQVVAFDRDGTGRIVTLGGVTRTGAGVADLIETRIAADGSVQVRVADRCCGPDRLQTRYQWRGYRWNGTKFRQTSGPSRFSSTPTATPPTGTPSRATNRLTISATDLVYGPVESDGWRRGSTTLTIVNPGDSTVEYPAVTMFANGKDGAEHANWRGCPTGYGTAERWVCVAEPLGPGERRRMVFPFVTKDDGPARTLTVRIDAAADRDGTVLPDTGNQTTLRASIGS